MAGEPFDAGSVNRLNGLLVLLVLGAVHSCSFLVDQTVAFPSEKEKKMHVDSRVE